VDEWSDLRGLEVLSKKARDRSCTRRSWRAEVLVGRARWWVLWGSQWLVAWMQCSAVHATTITALPVPFFCLSRI